MTGREGRVLVVDDEPAIRRLLKTSLAAAGYDVVEAATGEEVTCVNSYNVTGANGELRHYDFSSACS